MSKKYSLEVTEEHLQVLINALDLYTRVGIGQFEEVARVYMGLGNSNRQLEYYLTAAKVSVGHPKNGSFGIHNPNVRDEFRQAFDIKQVIRHRLAWDRSPQGGSGIDFFEPDNIGNIPAPKIDQIPSSPELYKGEIPKVGEDVYVYGIDNYAGGRATVSKVTFDTNKGKHYIEVKEHPGSIFLWEDWLKNSQDDLKKRYLDLRAHQIYWEPV